MFAVIDHNGSQLKVCENKEYRIPYYECAENDKIKFENVMLISGDKVEIGEPYIKGAYVDGEVMSIGQTPKTSVIKFHSKKRYTRIGNHRQDFVLVKISKIAKK